MVIECRIVAVAYSHGQSLLARSHPAWLQKNLEKLGKLARGMHMLLKNFREKCSCWYAVKTLWRKLSGRNVAKTFWRKLSGGYALGRNTQGAGQNELRFNAPARVMCLGAILSGS